MMKPVSIFPEDRRMPLQQKANNDFRPKLKRLNKAVLETKSSLKPMWQVLATIVIIFFTFQLVQAQTISGQDTVCVGSTHTYSTTQASPFWSVTGGTLSNFTSTTVNVTWTGPQNSTQTIQVSATSGGPATATRNVVIKNNAMVCENLIQVSLNQSGFAKIGPWSLLMGAYNSFHGFTVDIKTLSGVSLNDTVWCKNIGSLLVAKVMNGCDFNSCWTFIRVEDKLSPVLICPATRTIDCNVLVDTIPGPAAIDNCDQYPVVSLANLTVNNSDICKGVTTTRTWTATDKYGNQSSCTEYFTTPPVVAWVVPFPFPADTTWECSDYNKHPNIVNPTPLTGVLSTTGSGVPGITLGIYCPFSYSHKDQFLKACGGAFKIIRTWTIVNWCSNQILTHEQIIKVIDRKKPQVYVPPILLSADIKGKFPIDCAAITCLPGPTVYDECGTWKVRIWTPVGEAIYSCGLDGRYGGRIPPPGLTIGTHQIHYIVTDECGNDSTHIVEAIVVDDQKPVAVCREFVIVTLNNSGMAEVFPESFDKGSNDNCCIGIMQIKRMSQPNAPFAASIKFDCSDTGDQVILRVFDCFDNYNECMVNVKVQDKISPTCQAPRDTSLTCKEFPEIINQAWLNKYGLATTTDNCSAEIVELPHQKSLDSCGYGLIIRNFVAVDKAGNLSNTCLQTLNIVPAPDWKIQFPPDWSGICGGKETAPGVIVTNHGCSRIFTNISDQIFNFAQDGMCYKIIRTYRIVNECPEKGSTPLLVPHESLGVTVVGKNNFHSYEYQQIIKVKDDTPPTLKFPFSSDFCSYDDDCKEGSVFLPLIIDGECSEVFDISYSLDLHRDGSIDLSGFGFFEGALPLGKHRIHYRVKDGCKNESRITVDFTLKDCKHPITICESGLVAELRPNGTTQICASQLNAGSYDNCGGPIKFTFSRDPADSCRIFKCSDAYQHIRVNIYATDESGNFDYCETTVFIQDNLFHCDTGIPLVGKISTENKVGLNGVTITLNNPGSGNASVKTNQNGEFKFLDAKKGQDYSVTPSKNVEPLNGVTTFDLVLISRHILGIEKLSSPYKLIASDANRSGGVTTLDLVELRKLILFINPTLPNNTSWRFVDKNYVFPKPENPWVEPFPEVVNINNITETNSTSDFVAIKVGDVNTNAVTTGNLDGATDNRSGAVLILEAEDLSFEAGKVLHMNLRSRDFQKVSGFQFTLEYDKNLVSFESVIPNQITREENFGLSKLEEGVLLVSWYEPVPMSLTDGSAVISLVFTPKTKGKLRDVLSVSSAFVKAEAYVGEKIEVRGVELKFGQAVAGLDKQFELFQNIPNPFSNKTTIGFLLPESSPATLTVFDPSGKTVQVITGEYQRGFNEIILDKANLPGTGLLYYRLETPKSTAIKSMTLMSQY